MLARSQVERGMRLHRREEGGNQTTLRGLRAPVDDEWDIGIEKAKLCRRLLKVSKGETMQIVTIFKRQRLKWDVVLTSNTLPTTSDDTSTALQSFSVRDGSAMDIKDNIR